MGCRTYALVAGFVLWSAVALSARAQVPGIPPAPAPPGVPGVPGAPAVPGTPGSALTQGKNIWSMICLTPEQKEACRKRFCSFGLVQMLNAMMKPVTVMSGGLVKPLCPTPDDIKPGDLAKPAESADGAAARIKKDEAEAKARRASIRYLGTVDCSRYPEAEKALINALRSDANECVRLEAAIVLGHGCCCTRDTINALKLTALASNKDGNPKESSIRVRNAAAYSLQACQVRTDLPPEPPEKLTPIPLPEVGAEVVRRPELLPPGEVPGELRNAQFLAAADPGILPGLPAATLTAETGAGVPTGQRGLFDLFRRSFSTPEPPR